MRYLFIVNDPPYGTEKFYNALRLAHTLMKRDGEDDVTVFLMADAVAGARKGQQTPDGFYNIESMLKLIARRGRVLLCGTCMDARGMTQDDILDGAQRSTMDELAETTANADHVLTF